MSLSLGIELGSTRIKAVLIDETLDVICQGVHVWEDQMIGDYWSYSLDAVWAGIQEAYASLSEQYFKKYNQYLRKIDYIGFSAMMHGYLAFDKDGKQLVPFRTWRNVNTDEACNRLSQALEFNIPHRWSVAHLYQAILNREEHLNKIDFITTLAAYVHWQLTGNKFIGIGDAAGMFPVDSDTKQYDTKRLAIFNALPEVKALELKLETIMPEILVAGENAGSLTQQGALLIDPSGKLEAGSELCPPEGDAGTGMVATNSVKVRTGNISLGTSVFAMFVLENELKKYYNEIDMVTTPDGLGVAMVHCNNGAPELDDWLGLFSDILELMGHEVNESALYKKLFEHALTADLDCDDVISVNFIAGEPIAKVENGRPMYIRKPESKLNLSNFMLSQLYAVIATLRIGIDILISEGVELDSLVGHGGVFKTKGVMQEVLASALNLPVEVYESAGEGGAWGIALLAHFMSVSKEFSLSEYLENYVFTEETAKNTVLPNHDRKQAFERYLQSYRDVLSISRFASENW